MLPPTCDQGPSKVLDWVIARLKRSCVSLGSMESYRYEQEVSHLSSVVPLLYARPIGPIIKK